MRKINRAICAERLKSLILACVGLCALCIPLLSVNRLFHPPPAIAQSNSDQVLNAAELQLALKKLTVLGSALYVAAHPDDENTALLAFLSKGKHIRAAYLSVTRGEGGQNLVGSEQGDQLGIIRTQELLAARRIDGAEQFFTRAKDFGFSKSSEETLRIWGKEGILSDMVWIIRTFRPDVIITRFSPTLGGHGNHTASAILAEEAFQAAGDPTRFPDQLKYAGPWKAKRLVFNTARFFGDSPSPAQSIQVDLGEYDPLLGKSFTEIAGLSRSMHKSQGFGAGQNRGSQINYFKHTAGEPATGDLFDGVNLSWSRVRGGESIGKILDSAYMSFRPENPKLILPVLMQAYTEMQKLGDDPWVAVKKRELIEVIRSCAGIWIDALASEYSAVPGNEIKITISTLNRSDHPFALESVTPLFENSSSQINVRLAYNQPFQKEFRFILPKDYHYSQPYWLQQQGDQGAYQISDQRLVGLPENQTSLAIKFKLASGRELVELEAPVRYRWIDPVEGDLYRPLEIIPPVAINLKESVYVYPDNKEKKLSIVLKSGTAGVHGRIRLHVPEHWSVSPTEIPFDLKRKQDEMEIEFRVRPSAEAQSGAFTAVADVDKKTISEGLLTIRHQHIPPQTLFPPAEGKLVRLDLKRKGQLIGYIQGPGDEIPVALKQVGYSVTVLSDEDLASRDLKPFDAIIAGVRAYNTRPALRTYQSRLMEYVKQGGTYIVQYVTLQRLESENLGPYRFRVSRDRVSVEEAPVKFLAPQHPILNQPNKLTDADFEGWIQERGLYFADQWDPKYETVIASNDPGESSKAGGLIFARYGKGYYIYTGYSFFRQLPAGVPGAYRLFVNMISIGK